jgi:hypothetical protein
VAERNGGERVHGLEEITTGVAIVRFSRNVFCHPSKSVGCLVLVADLRNGLPLHQAELERPDFLLAGVLSAGARCLLVVHGRVSFPAVA